MNKESNQIKPNLFVEGGGVCSTQVRRPILALGKTNERKETKNSYKNLQNTFVVLNGEDIKTLEKQSLLEWYFKSVQALFFLYLSEIKERLNSCKFAF